MTIETNITTRWEQGIPHHPKSEELFAALAKIDLDFGNDYFGWKSGGDGDNGEHFMYELDIYFESADLNAARERVEASGAPSLAELREKFGDWDVPEVSGTVKQQAWEKPAMRLVGWRHCMSYNDSYFGEPAGALKQTVNELRHLLPLEAFKAAKE